MIRLQKKRMKQIAPFLLLCLVLAGCGRVGLTDPETTPEAEPAVDYSGLLRISELMVKNKASVLAPAFPDWAELENLSAEPVDLSGWTLSDGAGKQTRPFSDRILAPGERLAVFLGQEHTGFSLSQGETLFLRSPEGALEDSVFCASDGADLSWQLQADGTWAETQYPSPGFENTGAGYDAWQETLFRMALSFHLERDGALTAASAERIQRNLLDERLADADARIQDANESLRCESEASAMKDELIARQMQTTADLEQRLAETQHAFDCVVDSRSFAIGRAATALPRKLRDGARGNHHG